MGSPAVVIAYANDPKNELEWLEKEFKAINKYFLPLGQSVQIIPMPAASLKDIYDVFEKRLDDIILFHFSGHANHNSLQFDDGAAGKQGLAELMGMSKSLKLVFLNGCATKGHVDALHANNVKSVIATYQPVGDKTAASFSITFYSGLCQHWNVGKSFNFAKSFITAEKNGANFSLNGDKSRHLSTISLNPTGEMLWGIFYNKEKDEVEQKNLNRAFEGWRLPDSEVKGETILNYKPNVHLIESIASNSKPFYNRIKDIKSDSPIDPNICDEFEDLIKYYNESYDKKQGTFRRLACKIKNILPYPTASRLEKMIDVGTEIQRDLENNRIDYEKYRKLITSQLGLYQALIKQCGLTMLSDLFNLLLKKTDAPKIELSKGQYAAITNFLNINQNNFRDFDYTTLIKAIREIFQQSKSTPYIIEYEILNKHFVHDEALYESHIQLTSIEDMLEENEIDDKELQGYCNKVEHILWKVLELVYFVMRYKLVVIRRIEIIKFRIDDPTFSHNIIQLHQNMEETWPEKDCFSPSKFTDSYSVMVLRGLSYFTEYLNLSPFSIDLNVLQGDENSQLVLYAYTDENGGMVYEQVQHPGEFVTITLKIDFDSKAFDEKDNARKTVDPKTKEMNEKAREIIAGLPSKFSYNELKAYTEESKIEVSDEMMDFLLSKSEKFIDYVDKLTIKTGSEKSKITARLFAVWRQYQKFKKEVKALKLFVKD